MAQREVSEKRDRTPIQTIFWEKSYIKKMLLRDFHIFLLTSDGGRFQCVKKKKKTVTSLD